MTRPTDRSMTAILGLAAATFALPALAGECPADKVGRDLTKPVTRPAKDVTDTVLTKIELAQEPVGLKDHELRCASSSSSRAASFPGTATATDPRSSTSSRARSPNTPAPARSRSCTRPARSRPETSATAHWWKNTGSKPVPCLRRHPARQERQNM